MTHAERSDQERPLRIAEAVPFGIGGTATRDGPYQGVGFVFPENVIAKQFLAPYFRSAGKGF